MRGRYTSSNPVLTDNQDWPIRVDAAGRAIVTTSANLISVTPVCDTNAYGAGDVLFDRTLIAGATSVPDAAVILDSIVVLDEDDQTAANLTLVFLDADVTLGTANSAPSISDTNARNIIGAVVVASGSFIDIGGAKVASVGNLGLILKPATGTSNIYVAGFTAGTPTQTASGIKLRLGFRAL